MTHRDLLAEIELTMVPSLQSVQTWTCTCPRARRGLPEPSASAELLVRAQGAGCRGRIRDESLFRVSRPVGVNRCSAFEEPDKVACGRACLDSRFRRQWPYALPVADNRRLARR